MGISVNNATVSEGGGDFVDIPDDIYAARVMDVSDMEKSVNPTTNEERTQIVVTFELMPTAAQVEAGAPSEGYQGSELTRKMWITLTDKFLDEGMVHKKSMLYALLDALGYDMDGPLTFDSDEWIDMKCRVLIKHNDKGYPRIDSLLQAVTPKAAATPRTGAVVAGTKKQPVGAGLATRLRGNEAFE
mgnify:CR=1